MGKSSGGVRGGGGNAATEQGYTEKMKRNILGMERAYRNNKDETLHVFTPQGDLVRSIGGKGAKVVYSRSDVPENSIMTHNHPRSIGTTGIRRIGNSFSPADISSAIAANASEIRAVTPTYTFSIKRPAGGWGITAKQAKTAYTRANSKVQKETIDYLNKTGWKKENIDRAEVAHWHKVAQIVSKRYGWGYSKKRG